MGVEDYWKDFFFTIKLKTWLVLNKILKILWYVFPIGKYMLIVRYLAKHKVFLTKSFAFFFLANCLQKQY